MDAPAIQISPDCFFNLLHRNAGTGCWSVSLPDGQFWFSDACFDLLGRKDNDIFSFEYFLDVMVHAGDRHIVTKAAKQFLYHQRGTFKGEVRIKNGDGVYHWFEIAAEVRNEHPGSEVYLYGLLTNIDEKKLSEAESRKLKLMTDVVDDMMGAGIMEIDFATNTRYLSKAIYDILELPYDTPVAAITRENVCNPKDLKRYQTAIALLQKEKKPYDLDIRIITAKQNTCWLRLTGKPVLDEKGRVTGLRSTVQRIEKEKLKENFLMEIRDRIKEQKFFLDETSSMSNVGGWEFDLESHSLFWSDQTKIIHSVDTSYIPTLENAFSFYTKHSLELLTQHFNELMATGKPYDLELEMITAKSELIWIRAIGKPVYHLGKIVKLRGVAQDITAKKLREIELNTAFTIINEQNDKLKDFTHIVSHNLRSHAGNLKMISEMVELEKETDVKLEWMGLIRHVSNSLSQTVNSLTGLVNLNVENKRRLLFSETFSTIEQSINYKIISDEVELTSDFSACNSVEYVPAYLESIMLNLITNAIKYRHPDRKPVISLRTEFLNGRPVLTIADNGLGIDLEQYGSRLFKMNQTFHHNSDARGIGLYITKNQVEMMGGTIEVESTVNKGTTFTIYF